MSDIDRIRNEYEKAVNKKKELKERMRLPSTKDPRPNNSQSYLGRASNNLEVFLLNNQHAIGNISRDWVTGACV